MIVVIKMVIGQDLLFLLLQSLCGAASGYITNKYAVNMLFNEYTPLKIGGVVKKNKDKFIKEISSLVERDIINERTLRDSIDSEEFEKSIHKIVEDYFSGKFSTIYDNVRIKEIPCFSNTKDNILEYSRKVLTGNLESILLNLCSNINLNNIISKEDLNQASGIIFNNIKDSIKDDEVSKTIDLFFKENKELKIADILSDKDKNNIILKINGILRNNIRAYFKDESNYEKIIDCINLKNFISSMVTAASSKHVGELWDEKEIKAIIYNLLRVIDKDEINSFILELIQNIKENIENLKLNISDIVYEDVYDKLYEYLCSKIPAVFPAIEEITSSRKEEINMIIEDAVNEAMDSYDEGIRKLVISKLRSIMDSDDNIIAEKIKNYYENINLSHENEEKLKQVLKSIFDQISVSSIVSQYSSEDILNLLRDNKSLIVNMIYDGLCKKTIGEILQRDYEKIVNGAIGFIKKITFENNSFQEKICLKVQNTINSYINKFYNTQLSQFNFINNIVNNKTKIIDNLISENAEEIKSKITDIIFKNLQSIDLYQLIREHKISDKLINYIINSEETFIINNKDEMLKNIMVRIFKVSNLESKSKEYMTDYIKTNFNNIISGKIEKIIARNLKKFNEDEICEIAQKFMGSELKPLSVFGGILGGILGFVFGIYNSNVGIYGFYNSVIVTIESCILMGVIGVLTNVIALKMLFHPYKKNKFLAALPFIKRFSLGYIPSHKESFATGIGNLIENELLSSNAVKNIFYGQKHNLSLSLYNQLEKDNYKIISNAIGKNKKNISKRVFGYISNYINKNIGRKLSFLKNISFSRLYNINSFKDTISKMKEQKSNFLQGFITTIKSNQHDKLINDICSHLDNEVKNLLDKEFSEQHILSEGKLRNILLENKLYENISQSAINNILSEDIYKNMKKSLLMNFDGFFKDNISNVLIYVVRNYLENQLEGEKTFNEVFNGVVRNTFEENYNDILNNGMNMFIRGVQQNRYKLYDILKDIISDNLNFFEKAMFMMAGGNKIIEKCVDIIVDIKISTFCESNDYMIYSIFKNVIEQNLLILKCNEINLKSTDFKINEKIVLLKTILINDAAWIENFHNMAENVIETVSSIRIEQYMKNLNIHNSQEFYFRFKNLFEYIRTYINDEVNNNSHIIKENLLFIAKENIEKLIKSDKILKNIDYEYMINIFIKRIDDSIYLSDNKENLINKMYDHITCLRISDLLNFSILERKLSYEILNVFNNHEFEEKCCWTINHIIDTSLSTQYDFMDKNTKSYICKYAADGAVDTVINNMTGVLKSIRLKETAFAQICHMDSKEIHMLFQSFCGTYFRRLYLYGSFGAVFGINLYSSLIIFVCDEIMNKK